MWEIKNLEAAAIDDGLEIEEFNSREDVINSFGGWKEDIPASYWEKAENFNAEQAAREFLLSDYEAIIEIQNLEDARYYAEKYDGSQQGEIRRLAREILNDMQNRNSKIGTFNDGQRKQNRKPTGRA